MPNRWRYKLAIILAESLELVATQSTCALWTRHPIGKTTIGCRTKPAIVNIAIEASFLKKKLYSPLQLKKKTCNTKFFGVVNFF